MLVTNYSPDDLKKLPLRAIVAFAARCARRVQRAAEEMGQPDRTKGNRESVEIALRLAEDVALGKPRDDVESVLQAIDTNRAAEGNPGYGDLMSAAWVAAHAAGSAWYALGAGADARGKHSYEMSPEGRQRLRELDGLTADLAVLGAFTVAEEGGAATQYSDEFLLAAIRDYEKLLSLNLGSYPDAGQPVDPSPQGPLGPL
jgi:hypothetical protein